MVLLNQGSIWWCNWIWLQWFFWKSGASSYQGAGGGGAGTGGSGSGPGGYGRQLPPAFRDPNSTVGDPGTYGGATAPTPGGFWVAGGGGAGDPSYPGVRRNWWFWWRWKRNRSLDNFSRYTT